MKDFEEQLSEILNDYEASLTDSLNQLTETTANQIKSKLSESSPVGARGKLAKSWKISKEKLAGLSVKATVHSTQYRILHLVENGHLTKNGTSRTKASHFMQKTVDEIIPQYEKAVEEVCK